MTLTKTSIRDGKQYVETLTPFELAELHTRDAKAQVEKLKAKRIGKIQEAKEKAGEAADAIADTETRILMLAELQDTTTTATRRKEILETFSKIKKILEEVSDLKQKIKNMSEVSLLKL